MTNQFITGLVPTTDGYAADPDTDRVRCPRRGELQFEVVEGAGGTGTALITAEAHIANSGGTPEAIPFRYKEVLTPGETDDSGGWTQATAAGFTTTAGAGKRILVEFRADELPAGKPFVSLNLTEVADDPVVVYVGVIVKGGDHPGSGNTSL